MMAVVKVIELVGTSHEGWEGAVQQVVKEALASLREITGADAVKHTALVENGNITEYRATDHVVFTIGHHSHLLRAGAASK